MRNAIIFGGYGNFGKILSRSFLKDQIPVIICGRNATKLQNQYNQLQKQFKGSSIQSCLKDVNEDLTALFQENKSAVLINTCGPFQTASYKIVQKCISMGIDYIDLADGRDFVTNMSKYHEQAKNKQVTVITGASSVPGLSSAIIEEFKHQFSHIESVRYGISPGQRTTRGGIATVKGVMGYVGKPIKPFGDLKAPIYGWQDLYMEKYPTLGYRLFGNCEVPDLDLFPKIYGINNIRFSAGMESKLLHLGIWFTSWLIRLGVPIKLINHAQILLNFSHWGFDWLGTDEGGLHMMIRGTDKDGRKIQRKWYIIVRKGQGPNVPVAPAIILGKKLVKNQIKLEGVHPCVGLVTLSEYLQQLSDFDTSVFTDKIYI